MSRTPSRLSPLTAQDQADVEHAMARRAHGSVASALNDRSVPWRTRAERDLFLLLEADTSVLSYKPLPERVTVLDGERRRSRIPSARVETLSGTVVLDAAHSRHISATLTGLLTRAYGQRGIPFRVIPHFVLRLEPRWTNVRVLLAHRRVPVPHDTRMRVLAAVTRHERATVDAVAAACPEVPDARAAILAMAMHRTLHMDLGAPDPGSMLVTLHPRMGA